MIICNIQNILQGIQERDSQIKMLTDQVEQYTKEMEKNTFIIEDLKNELQRNKGNSMFYKYIVILYTIKFLKYFIFIKMKLYYANRYTSDFSVFEFCILKKLYKVLLTTVYMILVFTHVNDDSIFCSFSLMKTTLTPITRLAV